MNRKATKSGAAGRPGAVGALLALAILSALGIGLCDEDLGILVNTGEEFMAAIRGAVALPLHIRLAPGATINVSTNTSMLPRFFNNGTLRISSDANNPATLSLGWASEATVSTARVWDSRRSDLLNWRVATAG